MSRYKLSMKNFIKHIFFGVKCSSILLCMVFLVLKPEIQAQSMGISNNSITPDPSSILEMRATDKGMLVPRMTTGERDAISSPATGLMMYNISTNQFNFYNGTYWVVSVSGTPYLTADNDSTLTTSSSSANVISGMSKTALEGGSYMIFFNSQVTIPASVYTTGFSSSVAAGDLHLVYADIMAIPATNTTHPLVFGSGETLLPGVYDIPGAASITDQLNLDGNGDPNALFMIRATGAFDTGAGVNVVLTNGATAKNVFWIADGAIGLGVSTTLPGTVFSHGAAVAVGANCTVTGRLLTTTGAISFGEGSLSLPTDSGLIDFRSLSSFIIYTNAGGVANTGLSIYTGDIGTNGGAITSFGSATVNGTIFQSGSTTVVTPVNHVTTFSLYKNGVVIPNSSRTRTHLNNPSDISLQAITSLVVDDVIEVKWKIDTQPSDSKEVSVANRILTLIKIAN